MNIKETLQKYNIKIKKDFGQNFLINKGILETIIKESKITKNDTIIEIGPGLGVLTEELLKNAKKVISLEKDTTLKNLLTEKFNNNKNFILNICDALEYECKENNYKVIANIPYYITSPLIRHFLNQKSPPKLLVLLVQKEVAEKICDEKKLSILSLQINLFAKAKKLKTVSKNSFYPAPKVNSAIIEITPYKKTDKNYLKKDSAEKILNLAKIAFSQKRKKFFEVIRKNYGLSKEEIKIIINQSKIDENIRVEDLSINELEEIATYLHQKFL